MKIKEFEKQLKSEGLSQATITAYTIAARQYNERYKAVSPNNLMSFKAYLVENYKPKSVNLKIQGINKYLELNNMGKYKLKFVKLQQKKFLENVISDSDYKYLVKCLKRDGQTNWYFIVRYLCSTGARISELVQIKIEDIRAGYIDIYGKGGKMRRIYIPNSLRKETIKWIDEQGISSGYLFTNNKNDPISTRGISKRLKSFAVEYGINPDVVYPHSFRHRFAKNFLDRKNDLALLADLLGHESIETTRIYLRQTANEQQEMIDKIVTW